MISALHPGGAAHRDGRARWPARKGGRRRSGRRPQCQGIGGLVSRTVRNSIGVQHTADRSPDRRTATRRTEPNTAPPTQAATTASRTPDCSDDHAHAARAFPARRW